MKSVRTITLAVIFIGGVLWGGFLPAQPPAWSQLMIIEYVDQMAGNGVGLEIYNPSLDTVYLASDNISIRFFNHTDACTTSCPGGNDNPLAGQIPPGETFVIGNTSYCNSCTDSCDFAFSYGGLNGNDAVLLTRLDTAIDMIGIPCFCIGMNCESYTVNAVADALCEQNIARCIDNEAYYSDSSGVYVPGDATTSWPNNRTTNVLGWVVSNAQCIVKGHTAPSCGPFPIVSLNAWGTVENCRSLINWTAEKADSFQVVKQEEFDNRMVRVGVVYPQPGESQFSFSFTLTEKEYIDYQVIAWVDGERTVRSNLVKSKALKGNCILEAASLYPIPANDDLNIRLPQSGPLICMLYDVQGHLLIAHEEPSDLMNHSLSIKELSEGLYFYKIIYGENQRQTGKLIVHRE